MLFRSLLSTPRADDAISEQLVELIGFDNIELSMQLLEKRREAVEEISSFLHNNHQSEQPAPVTQINGRGKGKQREGTATT